MSGPAGIMHADLDAFYASVEQRDDPSLRGKPVGVGGGVILTASYEARRAGVKPPTGIVAARRACPDLRVVPLRFEAYSEASKAVFAVFEDTAPVVEKMSIDEAFLDVRGMDHFAGSPVEIGRRLRERVLAEVGLPLTVGIASTKHLAKVASNLAKPDGLLEVQAGTELDFLDGLRVEALWGVGPKTAERLHALGLVTCGQVRLVPERQLIELLGPAAGRKLHALANNRDARRVRTDHRRRSFGAQSAMGRGPHTRADVDARALALAERVTRRMRRKGASGRTVVLRLRFADFETATRSRTLRRAASETDVVLAAVRQLLVESDELIRDRGITLVGIAITNLEGDDGGQLAFDFDGRPARRELDVAVDAVRDRFGTGAVQRGRLLKSGEDLAPWLLE